MLQLDSVFDNGQETGDTSVITLLSRILVIKFVALCMQIKDTVNYYTACFFSYGKADLMWIMFLVTRVRTNN